MIIKGFRFGMLLQLAVGPVCIFIFQTASLRGFYAAVTGIFGVSIVDGLFILAAILGIASIIERKNTKLALKIFGAIILSVFGLSTVLSVFDINFLPSLSLHNTPHSSSVFLHAIILTVSNPLTIIFWAGVFSAKISEENMRQKDIYAFGLGALLSTVIFLALVAIGGSLTKTFLPSEIIEVLNLAVGFMLIYFGIRMVMKKI